MKIIFRKILITLIIFISIGSIYLYFSYDLEYKASIPIAYSSSLSSSNEANPNITMTDDKVNSEISFLLTLASLKNIKIDTTLFNNNLFNRLRDNTVSIDPVIAGRLNPFAPIEAINFSNALTIPKLTTDQPSQITDKSVILNGTVNVALGVKNIYFEYGLTQALGTKTPIIKQSLVGVFLKSITELIPQTNYFYRAVAEINGVLVFGEIVSFTTTN